MAAPSAIAPLLTAPISGTTLSDGKIAIADWDSHEGTMKVGASWGFREGQGAVGVTVPSRGGTLQLVAFELKVPTIIEDDSLTMNVYDENNGRIAGMVDIDVDLLAGTPGKVNLPTPINVPAGMNIGVRFTTTRTQTELPLAVLGLYFAPTVVPGAPTVVASNALTALGAREDDSYGIWGSSTGPLTVDSVFSPKLGPRVDIGFDGGSTAGMEIWAVGFRAGIGEPTSSATIGIRNHADDFNFGEFTTEGSRWAQMLVTPVTYPADASIGFTCEGLSGPPMHEAVCVAWVREIVTLENAVYVADPDHELYIVGGVYTSP